MDRSTFESADLVLDEIANEIDELLDSEQRCTSFALRYLPCRDT
jgi:hypothetical protein